MISFLVGIIEEKQEGSISLDVNGVGYLLYVSNNTLSALPEEGETIKIYTYMSVREDDVSLFGFSSKEEKQLFLKLTLVSGIGPKVALSILSGLPLSQLIAAIIKQDLRTLSSIKGLGKKTAERLCLELKDKISPMGVVDEPQEKQFEYDEEALSVAVETLISLGVNKNQAYQLAKSNATATSTAEDIILKSLRGYRG